MYCIELYFETAFEQRILTLWDSLEQANLPVFYRRRGVRPHFTLSVLEQCDEQQLRPLLPDFARTIPRLSITFPLVGLFPGEQYGVCLLPIVTQTLLDLHAALYTLLCASENPPVKRYLPDQWVPHCPLSKELSHADAVRIIEVCSQAPIFDTTGVIELGFAAFRPRRDIQCIPLGLA